MLGIRDSYGEKGLNRLTPLSCTYSPPKTMPSQSPILVGRFVSRAQAGNVMDDKLFRWSPPTARVLRLPGRR